VSRISRQPLAGNLRHRRHPFGWSQEQLAERGGVRVLD
jgi:hypothetical protein